MKVKHLLHRLASRHAVAITGALIPECARVKAKEKGNKQRKEPV